MAPKLVKVQVVELITALTIAIDEKVKTMKRNEFVPEDFRPLADTFVREAFLLGRNPAALADAPADANGK